MQKADAGDYGPLGELIARAMYDNLNRFIVPNVASPARLVPLASMADKHLSVAAPPSRPTREARGPPRPRRHLAQFAACGERIPAHQEEPTAE